MDCKNAQDLEKIIKLLRKNGISHLKMGDLELSVHPAAFFPETPYKLKKKSADLKSISNGESSAVASSDSILFWSSADLPEEGQVS